MEMNRKLLLAVAVAGFVLCFLSYEASALKCYVCNSHDDKNCLNGKLDANLEKDCDLLGTNHTYTMCRKIQQKVKGKERTIRQCAGYSTAPPDKCINRVGMKKIKVTHCHCNGDLCNAAPSVAAGPVLLGLAALAALMQ